MFRKREASTRSTEEPANCDQWVRRRNKNPRSADVLMLAKTVDALWRPFGTVVL